MYTLFSVVASNSKRVAVAVEEYATPDEAVGDALALWHEESGAFRLMFVERDERCVATLFSANDPEIVYVTRSDKNSIDFARAPRPT